MNASLQDYRAKRDFSRTDEPAGRPAPSRPLGKMRFVVHKHKANHSHYDLRLEMAGVLKSWAIPKGIPMDKGEAQLALELEDHPLEYRGFEGIIPLGNYAAGTVQLWDRGTYKVSGFAAGESWQQGKISLLLQGKKLRGHWRLVRTEGEGIKNSWLLIKTAENLLRLSSAELDRSVLSGKTIAELAGSPGHPPPPPRSGLKAKLKALMTRP